MKTSDTGCIVRAKYIPKFTVDFAIDGHSHIQSGATAPLPLIWGQAPGFMPNFNRSVLDALAVLFIPGGRVQRKKTEEIADDLVRELECTCNESKWSQDNPYQLAILKHKEQNGTNAPLFFPCIILPMDMDYAHIGGFPQESTTIYHEGIFEKTRLLLPDKTVDGVYYRIRKNALADEKDGEAKDVSKERPNRVWVFQAYKKQNDSTIAAVKKHPWSLIPMFHYEPRRWCNPSGGEMDNDTWVHGPWDKPFDYVATPNQTGLFIGFKMYPSLGYKPFDSRLPLLDDFYSRCADEKIPIMTHCSPGGMTTHEAEFYRKLDNKEPSIESVREAKSKNPTRLLTYNPLEPQGYFFDEYVHPKNWRPVLEKYPNLKLCLAHFGGAEWDETLRGLDGKGLESDWVREIVELTEYPNVYTDMSCFDLDDRGVKRNVTELLRKMKMEPKYRHLRNKVIFGVDWYLSLITKAPEYKKYVESFFDIMSEYDEWQWYRSALVNPATFYGLDKPDIIENIYSALKNGDADNEKCTSGYKRISTFPKQVETIRNELEKANR